MRRDWNANYKRGFDYGYTVGREDERNEHRDDSDRMTRRINELQAQVTDLNTVNDDWDEAYGKDMRQKERAAIVAWLRGRPSGYYGGARLADSIKRGDHLGGDDD